MRYWEWFCRGSCCGNVMGFSAFSVVLRLVIERTSFCVKRGKILEVCFTCIVVVLVRGERIGGRFLAEFSV